MDKIFAQMEAKAKKHIAELEKRLQVVTKKNRHMKPIVHTTAAPGWVGGFEKTHPNLASLKMLGNLDNIDKLDRQQAVLWPQFSWETQKDEADTKRCYSMFAPDISRLGYTKEGQVYSIICPQMGTASTTLGALNVEVTVTSNRGWVNEDKRSVAAGLQAEMTVVGKIWFSPGEHQNYFVDKFWQKFAESKRPFPSSKADAIEVKTFSVGNPDKPNLKLIGGESTAFPIPDFARVDEAWSVGNVSVEIGGVVPTDDPVVDKFNKLVVDAFNLSSGNMLQEGNVLSWNVWFDAPQVVNQDEWREHAEYWRDSIDADHGSPTGPGIAPRFFNGDEFKAADELKKREEAKFMDFLKEKFTPFHKM